MKLFLISLLCLLAAPAMAATGNASISAVKFSQTPAHNTPFTITVRGQIHTCYRVLSSSYDVTDNDLNVYIRLDDTSGPLSDCIDPADWATTIVVSDYWGDFPDNYLYTGSHQLNIYLDDDPVAHTEELTVTDYYGNVTLSPASGTYLSDQQIDFSIIFQDLNKPLIDSQATLNGNNITASLLKCLMLKNLKSSGSSKRAYRCSLPASYFQTGSNTLMITLQLSGGITINRAVTWTILEVEQ